MIVEVFSAVLIHWIYNNSG